MSQFCLSFSLNVLSRLWQIMADFVGIVAVFVDEYPLYLPLPAAHSLTAFLSALCALCGKKSLPRFMAVNFYHSQKMLAQKR